MKSPSKKRKSETKKDSWLMKKFKKTSTDENKIEEKEINPNCSTNNLEIIRNQSSSELNKTKKENWWSRKKSKTKKKSLWSRIKSKQTSTDKDKIEEEEINQNSGTTNLEITRIPSSPELNKKTSTDKHEIEKEEVNQSCSTKNLESCEEIIVQNSSVPEFKENSQPTPNEFICKTDIQPIYKNNDETVHTNSAQIDSQKLKLKLHERKKNFFKSFFEKDISTIKKEITKEILEEISKEVLSKVISAVAEKEMENILIDDLVNSVLLDAIKIVSNEKLTKIAEELFEDILSEKLPSLVKSAIWKPLGFQNPKGYCYLNSVVQVLGSCEEFKKDFNSYKWNSFEKTKDAHFVKGLFDLICAITDCNKTLRDKSLYIVQENITESSFGDDVYKCFMNLLTRVSNVIKTNIDRPTDHFSSLPITLSDKAQKTFERFKNRNPGFVFDNFYGQLTFQTVCKICNGLCNESFQMIKSLPLPVPKSKSTETLNSCVDLFFNESDVEVDEPMKCRCDGGSMSLKSITKLTHGPKYLFIYLNRGSYTDDGEKNNTNVTCDNLTIDIKTFEDQKIKYKLISVIDHVGDSAYGHYYCKCSFEMDEWWLLNDFQVKKLKKEDNIVTRNTIVFLFKITT